jgi:hypothetical protein
MILYCSLPIVLALIIFLKALKTAAFFSGFIAFDWHFSCDVFFNKGQACEIAAFCQTRFQPPCPYIFQRCFFSYFLSCISKTAFRHFLSNLKLWLDKPLRFSAVFQFENLIMS